MPRTWAQGPPDVPTHGAWGDRIGLFTFKDLGVRGYVDVDWFRYAVSPHKP